MKKGKGEVSEVLRSLSSARVVEDPAEITTLIAEHHGARAVDGATRVEKPSGCIALELRSDHGEPNPASASGAPAAPTGDNLKRLVEQKMPWRDTYADRAVPWWASDERVDGHGDIVRQSWDFSLFAANSPMTFGHNWGQPPVGRVVDWRVLSRTERDYSGPALWVLGVFATADEWDWADTVFRLVQSRFIVTGSVGFVPGKVIDVKDEKERQQLGLGRRGLIFEDSKLLEYSPVTLPANPGATIPRALAKSGSALKPWDLHVVRELLRQDAYGREHAAEQWARTEAVMLEVARHVWPAEEFVPHRELDVPVTLVTTPTSRARTGAVTVPMEEHMDDGDLAKLKARVAELEIKLERQSEEMQELSAQVSVVLADTQARLDRIDSLATRGEGADGDGDDAVDGDGEVLFGRLSSLASRLCGAEQ